MRQSTHDIYKERQLHLLSLLPLDQEMVFEDQEIRNDEIETKSSMK